MAAVSASRPPPATSPGVPDSVFALYEDALGWGDMVPALVVAAVLAGLLAAHVSRARRRATRAVVLAMLLQPRDGPEHPVTPEHRRAA